MEDAITPTFENEPIRSSRAYNFKVAITRSERENFVGSQPTNGDESRYPTKLASFTKCLPHDDVGHVDLSAYESLSDVIRNPTIAKMSAVPLPGTLRLASPLGGFSFSTQGPDSQAVNIDLPHRFDSAQLACEMVELYWMALLGDVPFDRYETEPLVSHAIDDLCRFKGSNIGSRQISPRSLFGSGYAGSDVGPRVSQYLLKAYFLDGVEIEQKFQMPLPLHDGGTLYLTSFVEWLAAQRGFPPPFVPGEPRLQQRPKFITTARDLAWNSDQSLVLSTYLKAAIILLGLGNSALDDRNPYKSSRSFGGLGSFDFAHLFSLLGYTPTAKHFNFQKWRHRVLRPEAFGARVDQALRAIENYPIHESLFSSSSLPLILELNSRINREKASASDPSYLLPCVFGDGAPTHPSFPAGHAVAAGIGVTLLKAWFDENYILPDNFTVQPSGDGTELVPYLAGRDGPPLTIGGELNKLAHNMSLGRAMGGIHFRMDCEIGNRLGETLAAAILSEDVNAHCEPFMGYRFTGFDNQVREFQR